MTHSYYGNPESSTILVQMVDDHDLSVIESEIHHIQELSGNDFGLIAVKMDNWNEDLSPWKAPAVFGKEDFGDGASRTLEYVLEKIAPVDLSDKKYYLGGYSLAGLFALWAAFQTDRFEGVAAASPSIWFPGFMEYMKENEILVMSVYLSLGDKEDRIRNPVMSSVGERIREGYQYLKDDGVDCILEWNQGNHFKEPDRRMAKAFSWVMNRMEEHE